jgi:hypothetical protein
MNQIIPPEKPDVKTPTPFDAYVPPKSTKLEIAMQIGIAVLAVSVLVCLTVLG